MADDILSSLKGMLGDNADEKINSVLNMLKSSDAGKKISVDEEINITDDKGGLPVLPSNTSKDIFSVEGLEYLSRIKGIVDEMGRANDPRSNLLMSLRPYMRNNRKKGIDNAIKLLNLSRMSGIFKI